MSSNDGAARTTATPKYPRDLAVRVVTRVLSDGVALDRALDELSNEANVSLRSWLQEVCSGTLRWKGRIDLAIDSAALKKKPTGWLRKAISVAAYQLIAQDRTSAGAVVSETVDQVRKREGEAPAKFTNAVLRRVSEHSVSWRELELRPNATLAEAARWASLPEWMWKNLVATRGIDWAKAYAQASLARPETWIRVVGPDFSPDWAEPGPIAESLRVTSAPARAVTEWPGFEEGKFFVQDISSQTLVAGIAARVLESVKGVPRALDLCASPGGKAAGLSTLGLDVTATDIDPERMKLLEQTVARAAAEVRVLPREQAVAGEPYDLVWVDAPCTGSGILRRHPDVRWLKRETDVANLNSLQDQLLNEAWSRVRAGGFLAYSVCSVLDAEGRERMGTFLKRQSGGEVAQEWSLGPQDPPHGDGFYGMLVRKKPA